MFTVEKLIKPVCRQLGGSLKDEYVMETLNSINRCGAAAGAYTGFTFYLDTVKFFKKNREDILALVKEMAAASGQTAFDFVSCFHCLKAVDPDEIGQTLYGRCPKVATVPNALAWYAAEEVARYVTNN